MNRKDFRPTNDKGSSISDKDRIRIKAFETEKEKERIMNKQLPQKRTKIEMGDYETDPSGYVTNVANKKVAYINNIRYEKKENNYLNSNNEALHYTDISKNSNYFYDKGNSKSENKSEIKSENNSTNKTKGVKAILNNIEKPKDYYGGLSQTELEYVDDSLYTERLKVKRLIKDKKRENKESSISKSESDKKYVKSRDDKKYIQEEIDKQSEKETKNTLKSGSKYINKPYRESVRVNGNVLKNKLGVYNYTIAKDYAKRNSKMNSNYKYIIRKSNNKYYVFDNE